MSDDYEQNNLYKEFNKYILSSKKNNNEINPSDATNTTDVNLLLDRDRSMMIELERMKEDRRKIIESITKDDKIIKSHVEPDSHKTISEDKHNNFDMIYTEYKSDKNKENIKNNVDSIDKDNKNINDNKKKGLKKQLSFGNLLKNKKKSVVEELIKKQESELTFQPKTNKLPSYIEFKKE